MSPSIWRALHLPVEAVLLALHFFIGHRAMTGEDDEAPNRSRDDAEGEDGNRVTHRSWERVPNLHQGDGRAASASRAWRSRR